MEDIKKTDDKVGQRSFLKPLLIILVLVILLGGGFLVYTNYFQSSTDTETASIVTPVVTVTPRATATATTAVVEGTADWSTYTNSKYGFSFKYPKEWASTKVENTASDEFGSPVFKVSFEDPDMKLKILCANNESENWKDATPTKTTCDPILSKLTVAQKEAFTGPKPTDNIFVRVYSKNEAVTLKDWLYNTYHQPNTELENYQVGQMITLAGLSGYFSSIGCCGSDDRSYVITSGNYVYSLGSNYFIGTRENETMPATFQKVAKTFTITK